MLGLMSTTDPVRERRRQVARWVAMAKRAGYLLLLASIVFVVAGMIGTFSGAVAAGAATCLIAGGVLLGPAIVLGYAVNAAEREDRERGV